jgi:hypothetical protein
MVTATRGKHVRAESIAALYEQDKVKHARPFPLLEDQLAMMTTQGRQGTGSPDRADALVWALTELSGRQRHRDHRDLLGVGRSARRMALPGALASHRQGPGLPAAPSHLETKRPPWRLPGPSGAYCRMTDYSCPLLV